MSGRALSTLPKYGKNPPISELYLQKSPRCPFAFTVLLLIAAIVLSPPTGRAVTYLPAVVPGQSADYSPLYYNCFSTDPSFSCDMDTSGFQDVDIATLTVVEVSGTSVTLTMSSLYNNGTVTNEGVLLDVETGFVNITSFGPGNYFVLAGNLRANDRIWNSVDAPTLNETSTKPVLGVSREVNFLNFSSSFGGPGYSFSSSGGFAFDRVSGILIEVAASISSTFPSGSFSLEFAIRMVDNRIWLDFVMDADPTIVNVEQGSTGSSTITVTRIADFSETVTLTPTSSPETLSCSLSPEVLSGSTDDSALSCSGPPGSYSVTVTAEGGYSIHEVSISFNIGTSATPDFAISNSVMIPFQTGSSGTATITLAALNGFSSTIGLQVSSTPLGLTCSLDRNSIAGSGSATLTCQGLPGTYTVTVTATSGPTTRTTQTTVTVSPVTTSVQPASRPPFLYIGVGIAAVVIVGLAALLFLRRKPEETQAS